MNEIDDAVLEFFEEQSESIALPPTAVWFNLVEVLGVLDKSKETVARRMRRLPDRGLLEKVDGGRGYYRITDKGRAYLSGDLDVEDLAEPDD